MNLQIRKLALGALISSLAFGQEYPPVSIKPGEILYRAFGTVPDDFSTLTMAPFRNHRGTGLVTGSLLFLVATDRYSTRAFQQHVEPNVHYKIAPLWRAPSSGVVFGVDTWLVAGIPVWYLGSLVGESSQGQTAAVLAAKAAVYSWFIGNVVLKTAFARVRPSNDLASGQPEVGRTDDPWKWGEFHKPYLGSRPDQPTSFPSFHFTIFLAVAQVFHEEYGNSWIPYAFAAVGLGSDIRGHMHWVSDMTGGTLLGMGIGHTVVKTFHGTLPEKIGKVTYSIKPWIDFQGQSGLTVAIAW